MNYLKGKKTYIIAAIGGVVTAAYMLGMIDMQMWTVIMGFLGAGGMATMRSAIEG